jgi:hypothetical protein
MIQMYFHHLKRMHLWGPRFRVSKKSATVSIGSILK